MTLNGCLWRSSLRPETSEVWRRGWTSGSRRRTWRGSGGWAGWLWSTWASRTGSRAATCSTSPAPWSCLAVLVLARAPFLAPREPWACTTGPRNTGCGRPLFTRCWTVLLLCKLKWLLSANNRLPWPEPSSTNHRRLAFPALQVGSLQRLCQRLHWVGSSFCI